MFTSVIDQNGRYAFGLGYYDLVLKRHSIVFKDYIALRESDTEQWHVPDGTVGVIVPK
jgi:hypothetical protein